MIYVIASLIVSAIVGLVSTAITGLITTAEADAALQGLSATFHALATGAMSVAIYVELKEIREGPEESRMAEVFA